MIIVSILKKYASTIIKNILRTLGLEVHRTNIYPELNLPDASWIGLQNILELTILKKGNNFQLVQIGCHDGKSDDPAFHLMCKYKFRALLVEPQPELLREAIALHSNRESTEFDMTAIAERNGIQQFYRLREESLDHFPGIVPGHYGLIKEQLLKQMKSTETKLSNFEEALESVTVEVKNFKKLLSDHDISNVDYLQIDTEGYDGKIILSIDFNEVQPAVINFEHAHLSKQEKKQVYEYLVSFNYQLVLHDKKSGDTTAYKFLNL
jgi:FkbM family methyltransferase